MLWPFTQTLLQVQLILKTQFIEICNRYNTRCISDIAAHVKELSLEVMRDFHMFLSNFSFQKIKNTFIQEKSKYIEVLDKYVSTVQNVVFSIPISIGITLMIKNIDSDKLAESIITVTAFLFYSFVSILIILQNRNSIELTEKILQNEKDKLFNVSTCNGLIPDENEFKVFFDMFDKKIKLVKLLSITVVITMVFLSFFFTFKVLVNIPQIHLMMRNQSKQLELYGLARPFIDILRFIF